MELICNNKYSGNTDNGKNSDNDKDNVSDNDGNTIMKET